jgi:hypothetical protein
MVSSRIRLLSGGGQLRSPPPKVLGGWVRLESPRSLSIPLRQLLEQVTERVLVKVRKDKEIRAGTVG